MVTFEHSVGMKCDDVDIRVTSACFYSVSAASTFESLVIIASPQGF